MTVLPLPHTVELQVLHDQKTTQFNKWLTIAFFTIPGMLLFITFVLIPIFQSAQFSLYRWDGFGGLTEENYVEFGNYTRLLNHDIFQSAVSHSLLVIFGSLMIQLPLALGLALLVGRGELPGRKWLRTILFIPYVFSEVITAILWLYVLHPNGLINKMMSSFLPDYNAIGWLGDRNLALIAIFAVLTWKYFGFYMLLYMAGLQGVPQDLEDAARLDGAQEFQVLRYITLPLLGSTIRLTIFLSVLGGFQQFVLVWVLTQGGPVNSTELIATYLYKFGISRFNLGYGSAVAVVLFLLTLVFSLSYQRLFMRQDFEYEAS